MERILGGLPMTQPLSDIPPVEEPILSGDVRSIFRPDETKLDKAKGLADAGLSLFGALVHGVPAQFMGKMGPEFQAKRFRPPQTPAGERYFDVAAEALGKVAEAFPMQPTAFTSPANVLAAPAMAQAGAKAADVNAMAQRALQAAGGRLEKAVEKQVYSTMEQGGLPAEILQGMTQGTRSYMAQPQRVEAPRNEMKLYSPAEEAALNLQRGQGRGEGFLNDLRKAGVRDEELEYTGLKDFLAGKQNVSKKEIQDYLAANKVQLGETTLGKGSPDIETFLTTQDMRVEPEGNFRWFIEGPTGSITVPKTSAPTEEDAKAFAVRYFNGHINERNRERRAKSSETKYDQYTLPGGENYREILLTLPVKQKGEFPPGYKLVDESEEARALGMNIPEGETGPWRFDGPNVQSRSFRTRDEALAALLRDAQLEEEQGVGLANYRSSHWEQPNVLAHLRVNDRVDADGKKMLLIEEIQSDWHQAGREKGYASKSGQLPAGWEVVEVPKYGYRGGPQIGTEFMVFDRSKTQVGFASPTREGAIANATGSSSLGVPDAPFKEDWYQLALKRALQEAVDKGYDRVGLLTGKRQVERYPEAMRQVVNKIDVESVESIPNLFFVDVDVKQGKPLHLEVENGIVRNKEYGELQGKSLREIFGKDLADKIISTKRGETQQLTGEDFTIGGEGMKKYYDEIYPGFLNKYGKKFDAKVGETRINPIERISGGQVPMSAVDEPVRYIDITPKMKEALSKGQPMFKEGGLVSNTDTIKARLIEQGMPEDKAFMQALKLANEKQMADGGLVGAYQKYIGQPFANVAGPFARGLLGLEKPEYGEEQAYRTGQALSNMPGAGAPAGILKAATQAPEALKAAQMLPEMLGGLLGATVFHGSPYKFRKFDPTKIGSGEGAQSYGHGHYVAGEEDVAKFYRDKLSDKPEVKIGGETIGTQAQSPESVVAARLASTYSSMAIRGTPKTEDVVGVIEEGLDRTLNHVAKTGNFKLYQDLMDQKAALGRMKDQGIEFQSTGSLYKIDLPDEQINKMLDWDKPLSQQSPEIKKAFESLGFDIGMSKSPEELHGAAKKVLGSKQFAKMANDDIYFARDLAQAKRAWNAGPDSLNEYMNTGDGSWLRGVLTNAKGGNQSGGVAYRALADKMGGFGQANYQGGGQFEASRILRELGIPGIRYLDQGSRTSGKGTSNYVVFPGNEDLLKILERNNQPMAKGGLAGLKNLPAAARAAKSKYAEEAAAAARASPRSKQEIESIAQRIAEQTQPGFVRPDPAFSVNPEGKSRAVYEMEQRTPMIVESTIEDKPLPTVDYEKQLGSVIVGVPGDPTMGQVKSPGSLYEPTRAGKRLMQVGDVTPETPVELYGGPSYGTTQPESYWASSKGAAQGIKNLVDEMAEKYQTDKILGQYMKMSPESSRYAMHNLDALISVLKPDKLPADKMEILNKMVREGDKANKYPQFVGFEDPIDLLLQAQMNPNLRKRISEVLEKPTTAKAVGFPFQGSVVQTAITEPGLRNLETGVTGYSVGQMRPQGELTLSRHPTYEYDIPGQLMGRSKYPIPYELAFPDFSQWFREHPELAKKVDPFNMLKLVGARQKVDPQYVDEIKMYEEAMKRLTGKKKGGLAAVNRK